MANSIPIISAHDLSKKFGVAPLFKNISFTVSEGDRIGLIGPNGSGKSTLLEILYGRVKPDSGDLAVRKGTRLACVTQVSEFGENDTVRSVAITQPGGYFDLRLKFAASGHVREVDLFIATPGGLFLVEIKSHPGVLTGDIVDWTITDGGRRRTVECPTRNPALTATLPSSRSRNSAKVSHFHCTPCSRAARGIPSTLAIIRRV